MFKIDGVEYDGVNCAVSGLTEKVEFVKGESDRTLINGDTWTNTIGIKRSHDVTLTRDPSLSDEMWEALWQVLLNINNTHTFEFPNGLNETITYDGEVTSLDRNLEYTKIDQNGNEINVWSDYTLSVKGLNRMDR